MGYRSDVVLVIANEFTEEFENLLLELKFHSEVWDNKYSLYRDKTLTVYEFYNWKWYDEHKEIQRIESFLLNLNDLQSIIKSNRQGCLVRMGEDYGDYEEIIGNGYDFGIYPQQQIITDG